jgi:O-antigen chain-terminating methyltransferase
MSAADQKTGHGAGVSADEVDVAAVFERLREEVRLAATGRAANGSAASAARAAAEASWAVTADRPIERCAGVRGTAVFALKRVVRKLIRWYVEPLAAEQRTYNDALLKLVYDLSDRLDREAASGGALERFVRELDERVTRTERRARGGGAAPGSVAAQPRADALPDYFAFESRMRGAITDIRERQRPYVDDFRDAAPVLDIGCGRGEFLALLREAGVAAHGVDADADMVAFAQGEGLDVRQGDALQFLESLADASLGGVFMAQVVEHLPPRALVRLLELAEEKLRPDGVLVAETINPLSPLALRNYFADLTHAQPLVPETLELLVRQAGFASVELRYLNEPDRRLDEPDDPVLAANVRRLNEILFAPLDYAVVARTPGA